MPVLRERDVRDVNAVNCGDKGLDFQLCRVGQETGDMMKSVGLLSNLIMSDQSSVWPRDSVTRVTCGVTSRDTVEGETPSCVAELGGATTTTAAATAAAQHSVTVHSFDLFRLELIST